MSDLKVTSFDEIYEGELHKLPSGRVFRLQKVSAIDFFFDEEGHVPDFFIPLIEGKEVDPANIEIKAEDMPALFDVMKRIVIGATLAPQLAMKRDPDKKIVGIKDVPDVDKDYIVNYATGGQFGFGLTKAQNFSEEQAGSLPAAPDGDSVSNPAESDAGANV